MVNDFRCYVPHLHIDNTATSLTYVCQIYFPNSQSNGKSCNAFSKSWIRQPLLNQYSEVGGLYPSGSFAAIPTVGDHLTCSQSISL